MIEHFLHRIALYSRRHYRRVFGIAAVALVVSVLLASRIRFDTEILNLLPADDPVVQRFRETLEDFGSLDLLLVVLRIPQGEVAEPYLEFADRLAPRLEALDEIDFVDYRIGEIEELVDTYYPMALMFLDEEGRRAVDARLEDEAIAVRAREIRRQLQTPQSIALQELLLLDPLGISDVFLEYLVSRIAGTGGDLEVDWRKGYLLSSDRSLLLMLVKPTEPAQEVEFGRRLIAAVEGQVAATMGAWSEIVDADGPPPPEVALGGSYVIAVADAGHLARDIVVNAATSMIGVLLLFWIAFRRLGVVVYAFVPLTFGLVLAFGFAAATVGTLNAATSGFAALLVGLGIDFVIVSYGRYVEERNRGARLSTALRQMTGESGRAVVTGGVTTAATFYAFMVTEFSGLREMGFLIGTGIFFCMASVLVILPAMLAWRDDRQRAKMRREVAVSRDAGAAVTQNAPVLHLHGFGTGRLIAFSFRHPVAVLTVGAIVTVASALGALRIEFVDSIRNLRPQGNPGVEVQEEVAEGFGSGFDYMMLVIEGDSEEQLLERTAEVTAAAQTLVEQGVLRGVDSISSLVPSVQQQQQALAWLEVLGQGPLAEGRLEERFERAALDAGLRPQPFRGGVDRLRRAVSSGEAITVERLRANPQTARRVDRYLRNTSRGWRSVAYLYPPPQVAKRQAPPEVVALAERLGPGVALSGVNTVSGRIREQVKSDAKVAASVGFVVVALLLWLDYRRLGDTALSLAPLLIGIVWMLGGMALTGVDMNFFNVFVTTMIIGIGVDYGVHVMHRYHEVSSSEELLRGLQETGKAIILAALSTSVGFGSMSFSAYPGLRSMGLVAIMGALTTAVVAVTLLPAFLSLRARRGVFSSR